MEKANKKIKKEQIFIFLQFQLFNGMEKRTNILDINSDCLHLIFEHLSVFDLLSVTEVSEHFLPLASFVVKRKFAIKTLHIKFPDVFVAQYNFKLYESEFNDRIEVNHLPIFASLLRHFGGFKNWKLTTR